MKGILVVRADRCLGCKSCEIACAVEHSITKQLTGAIQETPPPKARVEVAKGSRLAIPLQCRQCEDAPCLKICPTGALLRVDEESPVVVQRDLCIGCKWCVLACPFGVISLDEETRTVIKCDQCFARVEQGKQPACVMACPTFALEFKPIGDVVSEKRKAFLTQIENSLVGDEE